MSNELSDEYYETVLITVIHWGYIEIVKLLLEKIVDINVKNVYKETILMRVIGYDNLEAVKLKFAKNTNINIKDITDNTALMIATTSRYTQIVKLLKQVDKICIK